LVSNEYRNREAEDSLSKIDREEMRRSNFGIPFVQDSKLLCTKGKYEGHVLKPVNLCSSLRDGAHTLESTKEGSPETRGKHQTRGGFWGSREPWDICESVTSREGSVEILSTNHRAMRGTLE